MRNVGRDILKLVIAALSLFPITQYAAERPQVEERVDVANMLLEAMRLGEKDSITAQFDVLQYALKKDTANADVSYQLALLYTRMQDAENASKYIIRAANLSPENYWYNVHAALFNMKIGKRGESIKLYKRLAENNPDDEELHLMLAEAYLQVNLFDDALSTYDYLEVISGNTEYVAKTKATIYEHLKQPQKQIEELRRLADKFPQDLDSKLALAVAYLSVGDLVTSKKILDEVEAISTNSVLLYLAKAEYYRYSKDPYGEQRVVHQAVLCDGVDYETKKELIDVHVKDVLKRENNAILINGVCKIYESMIAEYPQKAVVYNDYAKLLLMLQQLAEAEPILKTSLSINPSDQTIWQQLAVIQYIQGKYKGMDKTIKGGKEYIQQSPQYNQSMAELYYAAGEGSKGRALLDESLTYANITPLQKSDTYRVLADMSAAEGNNEDAFAFYKQSLENNPNNHLTQNNYAYQLAVSGADLIKAERLSSQAVQRKGDEASYLDTYGWIFFLQGNNTLAELYVKKAMQCGGDKIPEVLEHYGDIKYKMGERDEALKFWIEAKAMGGDSPELLKKIETKGL